MLKTLVTTGVLAAGVLTGAAPAHASTGCGTLPLQVQGNPSVRAGQAGTTYLWHDSQGWKLRVTHPSSRAIVVSGTITASRGISHLSAFRLERGDQAALSSDGRTLTFRFTNVGYLDGVNFTAECSKTMRVAVRGATTAQVFLGAHRAHPTSVPFTIERS